MDATEGGHEEFAKDSLSGMRVLVVGAGTFGVWSALHLRQAGADVVLVDPWGSGNARSSSGGDSRVIRSVYGGERLYTEWVRRAFEKWRWLEHETGQSFYRQRGVLWMFEGADDYLTSSIDVCREQGFGLEELSVSDAASSYSEICFDGITSTWLESEAGYLLARQSCRAAMELAVRNGIEYLQDAVAPLHPSAPIQSVLTEGGRILEADQFVFAGGPWLSQLMGGGVGELVTPTRQEIHYFGPPSDDASAIADIPLWVNFGEEIWYGIPDSDGRGFKVADDSRGVVIDPTLLDRAPSPEAVAKARDFMARRFPSMATAPLVEARVCQYENSVDGNLIVDQHPAAENVWIVGGGSGHGFKISPAVGLNVAACLIGGRQTEPLLQIGRDAGNNAAARTQTLPNEAL